MNSRTSSPHRSDASVATVRADEPKAVYRRSLRWIPADSVAFVHVRFAELWDSPRAKAVATFIAGSEPRMMKTFEREFGVPLAQIDRLTLLLPDVEADLREPGVVIRITTRQPYDRAKLVAAMGLQTVRTGRRRWVGQRCCSVIAVAISIST